MYERFSNHGRDVMQLAQCEAVRLGHEYVGTEHILLGLLQAGRGMGIKVLESLKVDPGSIRRGLEYVLQAGTRAVKTDPLPLTPRGKRIVEFATDEARKFKHSYVGSEHILLALLREDEGVASQVLMNCGLRLEVARAEMLKLHQQGE
jgi:ATP-dependent Clp protease ATP-binding subunit ClpC